jgi:hypothetical protein
MTFTWGALSALGKRLNGFVSAVSRNCRGVGILNAGVINSRLRVFSLLGSFQLRH